ncbi:MAG: DUF4010 domain-containing protein [Bdellovibrionia bacterium]
MESKRRSSWILAVLYLFALALVATLWAPSEPIDPWGLVNLQKLLWMFFALSFIQFLGAILNFLFGLNAGMMLTGFLAGLVSSTALTVSLSQESRHKKHEPETVAVAALIAGKIGVLVEAIFLIIAADGGAFREVASILIAPTLLCGALLLMLAKRQKTVISTKLPVSPIQYRSVLRLTLFIAGILGLTRIAFNLFGESGVLVASFIVSLFEVHGALITAAQMFDLQTILEPTFKLMVALALSAAAISKIFIMFFIGQKTFALKGSVAMFLFIASVWVGFLF